MIEALAELLQERDADRPLDSLETVVVLTYLRERLGLAAPPGPDSPSTIRGWVEWAGLHSSDS